MDEYIKSIKAYLYDRTTSPLFGTFAASWLAWNYRFVVALLSELDAHEKFAYISYFIFPSWESRLIHGFLFPLATAIFIIVAYPLPAQWAYSYSRFWQNKLKAEQHRLDGERTLTEEDRRKLQAVMASEGMKHGKEMEGYITKIENLEALAEQQKARINELETIGLDDYEADNIAAEEDRASKTLKDNNNLAPLTIAEHEQKKDSETESTPQKLELSDPQVELLILIASANLTSEEQLIEALPDSVSPITIQYHIGELVDREFISRTESSNRVAGYSVTHQGRKFLVERGIT